MPKKKSTEQAIDYNTINNILSKSRQFDAHHVFVDYVYEYINLEA